MANGNLNRGAVTMAERVGSGTRIRCIVHDGTKADFVGKNLDDLFKVENGLLVPRDPGAVRLAISA